MARISIDDELHAKKEFKRLVRLVADEDRAVGMLYRFWHTAQEYWGDECKLVPKEEFFADGFQPILDSGLAEERAEGIYACGGEERFAWHLQRCRASKAAVRARPGKPKEKSGNPGKRSDAPEQESRSQSDAPESQFRSTGEVPPDHPSLLSASLRSAPLHKEKADDLNSKVNQLAAQASQCFSVWAETLRVLGLDRPVTEGEKQSIVRALQNPKFGGIENVSLALFGARHEPAHEGFNPRLYAKASRIFEPNRVGKSKFEDFLNWGAEARAKACAKAEKPAAVLPIQETAPPPEEVSKLLGSWSKGPTQAEDPDPETPAEIGATIDRELGKGTDE